MIRNSYSSTIFLQASKHLRILLEMGQFKALMYKNWILYKRSIVGNIAEFIVPILFIVIIAVVRKLQTTTTYTEQAFLGNPSYDFNILGNPSTGQAFLKNCTNGNSVIALIPPQNALITNLNSQLIAAGYTTRIYSSESDLESYIRSSDYNTGIPICFGIVAVGLSPNYSYKLRFNISTRGATDGPQTDLQLTQDQAINLELYLRTINGGMVGAATFVNSLILQAESNSSIQSFSHRIAPLYQQNYIRDDLYDLLFSTVGILVLLPLLLIYLRQTSIMLSEKEFKIRESMSIMGMSTAYYYITWFIRFFSVYLVFHIICSIIITRTLPDVPFYIPLIVFLLFDILLILQSFFIQIFFTRAKLGVVIALLFFVIQFAISFISTNSNKPSLAVNTAISIVPHCAYILAFQTMLYADSVKVTATFDATISNYIIQIAVISFVINIIVYLILTWYLDQVVPNQWGAKRHPLFCCFEKSISEDELDTEQEDHDVNKGLGTSLKIKENKNHHEQIESINENELAMEKDKKIIKINNLRKQFNNGETIAVKDLSVKMYNNEIFALLGHNGAGKTTTISMLTGMVEPTSGSISVMGETKLSKIRQMLGVCPQHDTLYEDLTVQEHIELFATFKGLQGQQLNQEVQKLIKDVNLIQKSDQYSKNLSGGQKRRLSVAMAFAGRSKIIILDEPTSGMDTSARRYIWELLKTYKNDRIIILTTHFMDEADYLGDKIGIMGGGKMLCCGSSLFLKSKYGVGYNITFVKNDFNAESGPIIKIVEKHIPSVKVTSDVSSELSMQLPLQQVKHFSALLHEIEAKKDQLKIAEYGISITTLEEVFLKVAEEAHPDQADEPYNQRQADLHEGQHLSPHAQQQKNPSEHDPPKMSDVRILERQDDSMDNIPRETGTCYIFFRHFAATFLKRLRVIRRDIKSFIFELILPVIFIIFALLLMQISFITDFSAQTINLNLYQSQQNPVVVGLASSNSTFTDKVSAQLNNVYGSRISLKLDATDSTVTNYDKNFLFPIKQSTITFKGGIFYDNPKDNNTHQITTLVNTRSPTSPLFLQTLAAQAYINSKFNKSITIDLINHPLPRTYSQLQINNTISGFFGSFIFSLALAFKFASIIAFIVKEREDRSKHQQIVSGMMVSSYWLANFIYDYLLYAIIAVISVVLIQALKVNALSESDSISYTWATFMLYGLAYIPFTYITANIFKDYGNAQAAFYFITFLLGGLLPILTFLLRIVDQNSNPIGRGLAWFFRIFPCYSFGESLINMGSKNLYSIRESSSVPKKSGDLEIALAPIIYLAAGFIIYLALVFVIEKLQANEAFMRCFTSEQKITDTEEIIESDVLAEYENANSADPAQYQILTKQLRKVYMVDSSKGYKIAVDNLSFAVRKGEVFGLLGVNGAGKTTTFKMLAGEVTSTLGDSYFKGMKISQNIDEIRQSLGYCPQFDALIQNLTVREQLEMFYDLKSLSTEFKDQAITQKIKEMNLTEYEDKMSGTLSGGNKRKLSVAMAMIGNPSIVFLDEPSTGMDPKARRFMWKIISRVATIKKQSTIILTTHSMEEAQALSTRLGIMVKGNFKCIGTPQHIKTKYGQGFQIEIKIHSLPRAEVEEIITHKKLQNRRTIREDELETILTILEATPEDKLEISSKGSGSHIFNTFKSASKTCEIYSIIEFLKLNKRFRLILEETEKKIGSAELLERIQSFMRLKIKQKISIAKLFEFFEGNKERFHIQQYTVKQATVEQIFNKFAGEDELSENQV